MFSDQEEINGKILSSSSPILSSPSTSSTTGASPVGLSPDALNTGGTKSTQMTSTSSVRKRKSSTNGKAPLRSRFGCENCKVKRVKCDETRPSCQRCKDKGFKCQYKIVLQFREDLENKGKKFGREGVWTKKKSKETSVELITKGRDSFYLALKHTGHLIFVNFNYQDLDHNLYPENRILPSLQASIIPHDIFNTTLPYDTPKLSYALNYYIDFIAPIFNPIQANSSTYLEETILHVSNLKIEKGLNLNSLVQYSQNHNHLFHLILSLGSVYLSKFSHFNGVGSSSGENEWKKQAKNFQNLGMATVKQELARIQQDSSVEMPTDLILSMVLLILYEVADDCNERWSVYLKLCRKLRNSRNFLKPKDNLEHSLLKFALEFLHYQESMGRTACKDQNSFFMVLEDGEEEHVQLQRVISWMGCERRLVDVISDITDLSFERHDTSFITDENYEMLCVNIRKELDSMHFNIDYDQLFLELGTLDTNNNTLNSDGIDIEDSELMVMDPALDVEQLCFVLLCEIKSFAAGLYLDCCLLNKSPEDLEVQREIRKLCKMLKFIILKNDFKWGSTLLWSIFIIGVEISSTAPDSEDLRYLILQVLQKLETYSLGNVNKVKEVVMNVWKKRDLDNSDDTSLGYIRTSVDNGTINNNNQKKANSHSTSNSKSSSRYLGFVNDWEKYVYDEKLTISLA